MPEGCLLKYNHPMMIKTCTPDDAAVLAAIGRETFYATYHHLNTPEVLKDYLDRTYDVERIRDGLSDQNSTTTLILDGGTPAAFLKVNLPPSQTDFNEADTLELQRIYVREPFKGRGYGRLLIDEAVQTANQHRCRYIWLSVWEKNPAAVSFYGKMGFHTAGTRLFDMGKELQRDLVLRYDIP